MMNHEPPRRTLTVALDEALLRRAEELGLSVEAEFALALARRVAEAEEWRRTEVVARMNAFDEKFGAFADEHSTL